MKVGLRAVLTGLAIVVALPAQPASGQRSSGPARWQVDWGDRYCTLVRHPAGDQPTLVLRTLPGSRLWELAFIRRSWPDSFRGAEPNVEIDLGSNEPEFQGRAGTDITPLGSSMNIHMLRLQFVERFAEAHTVSLGAGGHVHRIPIPQARQAVAAMRACEDDAMRQWGIDPVSFWQVSVPATGNLAGVFTDSDYPQQSLRTNVSGVSVVRMTIDVTGRVSECEAVAGSNNAVLDSTSCRILRERASLSPARDVSGNAIRSQLVTAITWRRYG